MFDSLNIPEARPIVWLKRVFTFVIVALLAIRARNTVRTTSPSPREIDVVLAEH